jgi:hypothetical protein
MKCSPQVNSYAPFAYDATYAVAHALHYLIEVRGVSTIVGSDLMDALIHNASFPGVTGTVAFFDGSANSDRRYHGDRRVGVVYDVMNFQSSNEGLVRVARWTPAAESTFDQRWSQSSPFVFSTLDNSVPTDNSVTCGSGQRLVGFVCEDCPRGTIPVVTAGHMVCQPCPTTTYEDDRMCRACVSLAARTSSLGLLAQKSRLYVLCSNRICAA